MLFNSLHFALFFPLVVAIYWRLRRRAQNLFLLAASYYFYGSWDWRFLSLIAASTVTDFLLARAIEARSEPRVRKQLIALSVAVNLGFLGFFKYFNFFAGSLSTLLSGAGLRVNPWLLDIALPVGISFYTFQSLSYTIDVYRGNLKASKSFVDFALFVSFWPHLVAGPIMRAVDLLPQVQGEREWSADRLWSGLSLMAWGLWKKILIADNLAPTVDRLFNSPSPTIWTTLLAGYAFAFQIYCDFSGYSDIARGAARTMGFELMVNFNLPYFSRSITEFWRRWHISLSTWLRDYLYISLGGNRSGRLRTYRNLMITMLLGGLWHGAAWTFVLWGGVQGALLSFERAFGRRESAAADSRSLSIMRVVLTFHLVCLSWIVFRSTSMSNLAKMLGGLLRLTAPARGDLVGFVEFALLVAPLLLVQLAQYRSRNPEWLQGVDWRARAFAYAGMVYSLALFGNFGGYDFIYFQF